MAENSTIARPYAKAVFSDAVKNKLASKWLTVLQTFSQMSKENLVRALILNPVLTSQQRISFFVDVIESSLPGILSVMKDRVTNFITLLADEKRLSLLPDIARLFQQLLREQEGVLEADMISAYPVSEDHRESMKKALEQRFHCKISLTFQVDETLIGGAVIRAGNWVIDGSVKGKLTKLAAAK